MISIILFWPDWLAQFLAQPDSRHRV